ncbi:MAG: universal stress protein [Burkholderiales bacterium]
MKILLPVDGSEGALAAVRHALRLMRGGLRASFVLANVQEPASLYEVVVAHDAEVIENVSTAAAVHSLEAAQTLMRVAGAEFESEISHGDPAHMLLDIAERFDCEMIVIGAQGVGTPRRRAHFGSVANAVLHGAAVPVMVVRSDP